MKLSYLCVLALSGLLFWGCANKTSSPILIERGVGQNEYEREYFVTKESMGIDKRLKDVFKQGYIEEGMTNDMVNLLWGQARLKGYENEWILEKIEGDRYGGSPAPTSSRSSNYN